MSASIYDKALISKLRNWTDESKINVFSPNDARLLFSVIADNTEDKPIKLPMIVLSRNAGYDILNTNKRVLTYDGITVESVQGPFISVKRESNSISDVEFKVDLLEQIMNLEKPGDRILLYKDGEWWYNGYHYSNEVYGLTYEGTPKKGDKIIISIDDDIGRSFQLNAVPISIPYQLDIYTRYFEEADAYARNMIFNLINYPTMDIIIPYNGLNILHKANVRIVSGVADNSSIPERMIVGQFTRLSLDINIDDAYLFDTRLRNNVAMSLDFNIEDIKFE